MIEPNNVRGDNEINGLRDLTVDLPGNLVMAEIGIYKGEGTRVFMQSGKISQFFAIDIWAFDHWATAEPFFDRMVAYYGNIVKLKMTFEQALPQLPPLDFIYIDADHEYESVNQDIETALKIIKPGGIIAGHDYAERFQGVIRAVDEHFGKPDKTYIDTSWLKYM
jgi:hypothetical protein